MPIVSIIVPNYNHARHLEKRLESIIVQNFQDFELILLDDASTDNSLSILGEYRHHHKVSHFLVNEINSGSPFRQWKKGIDLAQGKYIWIAESDDWADDRYLEEMICLLEKYPQSVLSYCQSTVRSEDGDFLHENLWWTDDLDSSRWRGSFNNSGRDEIENYLSIKNTIPNASAVVFKKETLNWIDWESDELNMLGDWLLWIKLLQHGNISYTPECLNHFRFSNNNTRRYDTFSKKLTHATEELFILGYLRSNKLAANTAFLRVIRLQLKRIILQLLGAKKPESKTRKYV